MKKFLAILFAVLMVFIMVTATAAADTLISDADQAPEAVEPPPPALEIRIWHEPANESLYIGAEVTIYSSLTNNEYYTNFDYQWQFSTDCSSWEDIDGATGDTYTTILDQSNSGCYYRLVVNYEEA